MRERKKEQKEKKRNDAKAKQVQKEYLWCEECGCSFDVLEVRLLQRRLARPEVGQLSARLFEFARKRDHQQIIGLQVAVAVLALVEIVHRLRQVVASQLLHHHVELRLSVASLD